MTTIEQIISAARAYPDRIALVVDGQEWSYDRLLGAAAALARTLPGGKPVIAIHAPRHGSSYVAILAVLLAGGTYVPLGPNTPDARNRDILQRSGASLLLHGAQDAEAAQRIANGTQIHTLSIDPEAPAFSQSDWQQPPIMEGDLAYILYTSGSTGAPKGVPVSHGNLAAYVENARSVLRPTATDRFSQTFDLTFDVSVHDLMVCWTSGATLCVASVRDLMDGAQYLHKHSITQWFCVPSLGHTMDLGQGLKPGVFTSLRTALFAGEALPLDLARVWQAAAPQARIENWYGPTETTIVCLRHRLTEADNAAIVPIGQPFQGLDACVLDGRGAEVKDGEIGELCIAGPQVVRGYLSDPERTAEAFVNLPQQGGRYYRTGDLVLRKDGVFHFKGRRDFQAKIRGYRVELGDVENALRQQAQGCSVAALAWPPDNTPGNTNATHIVAAIETHDTKRRLDRAALAQLLPDHMIPSVMLSFDEFPKTSSGKLDRAALAQHVSERLKNQAVDTDGSVAGQLLAMILSIKPALDADEIRQADTLMEAGLDSLDFIHLTGWLEERFRVTLTDHSVARLAGLSLSGIAQLFAGGQSFADALNQIPEQQMIRTNRAISFIAAYPAIVARGRDPLVLAFGSSGTMRAIDTHEGNEHALRLGLKVQVLNLGLPTLNIRALTRMAQFVVQTSQAHRVAAILLELDPMIVSTLPPPGTYELAESIYENAAYFRRPLGAENELDWSVERGGGLCRTHAPGQTRQPLWEKARDHEVARAYQGKLAFDAVVLDHWVASARWLSQIGAPVLGWVHPLAGVPTGGGLFDDMLHNAETATGLTILRPEQLDIPAEHFININHMGAGTGARTLTRQLVTHLLDRVE